VTPSRVSLLHLDDDVLWQDTVAGIVRPLPDIGRFASVSTIAAALAHIAAESPDILLLDVVLPDGDGLQLAQTLATRRAGPRVVLLSVRRDDVMLHAASGPHISGLLWKTSDVLAQLPEALRAVAAGLVHHPPEVREALRKFRADPQAYFKLLTKRELELLPRFGAGWSDEEVAAALGLSLHTVRSHRQNVMAKLGLPTHARLIHWTIQRGFVRPSSDGWIAREDEGASSDYS
jgi:DNA-binding NarL/FixJ family response regulator